MPNDKIKYFAPYNLLRQSDALEVKPLDEAASPVAGHHTTLEASAANAVTLLLRTARRVPP